MEEDKEIDMLQNDIQQLINRCMILNKDEMTATARVILSRDIVLRFRKLLQENKRLKTETDRMIDYIMIHQQVKTMRKIFCKHCKIQSGCTYSGIHRDCIRRYFEYVAKQESINEMHNDLELLEGDE